MLIADIPPWALLLMLGFSGMVTAATTWAVGRPERDRLGPARALRLVLAHVIWALLLFCGSVLGVRYVERLTNPVLGFIGLLLGAVLVSLARAALHRRSREAPLAVDQGGRRWLAALTYVLFALVLTLAVAILVRKPVRPTLFLPLAVGALLPDMETALSLILICRRVPTISRRVDSHLGSAGRWHSLGANVLIAVVTAPLILLTGPLAWGLLSLGFLTHLLLDSLRPDGAMLFWPLSGRRFNILGGPLGARDGAVERRFLVGLCVVGGVLLLLADLGPSPQSTSPAPSFEQSLQRYQGLRGRNLVYADVSGTWQSANRRVSARFEILGAEGESLVLLDRYSGRIFTGGRSANEDLYLYSLSVVAGSPARVKPVEVPLSNERLASALPILYAMQSEPGVQHITVSGEIVIALGVEPSELPRVDLAQNRLRKIANPEDRHYVLRYLTASEAIGLANLLVEKGELVVTATCVFPATGPTATPLPTAPAEGASQ